MLPLRRQAGTRGCVVIGLLLVGVFLAVVFAYFCTEYVLGLLDARRRVLIGEGYPLLVIVAANVVSFALVWTSAMVFIIASGTTLYYPATIVCLCAQAVWLSQHVWIYYRDRPRLRFEQ